MIRTAASLAILSLAACAIRPAGEDEERSRAAEAGRPFTEPIEAPPLPERPGAEDYLRHAFFSNAELRERYWEWRAAIEQIPQDSSFPNAAVSFGYLFSSEKMKAWDRTTLGISNDPGTMIPFPTKLAAAGRRALEGARAAGLRFEAAKFRLQGRIWSAFLDLALLAETIRIQEERVALLRMAAGQAEARLGAGLSPQRELVEARAAAELGENDLRALRSKAPPAAAKLNALVGRPAEAPVPLPAALPSPRALPVADADLIRLGSERSPELGALARAVSGREEALGLAKQAYIPDFGLSFSVQGSIERMLEGMLTVPLRFEAIRAGIEQAQALVKAAEAAREQYARDLAASFVLNLAVLRDAERQAALFEGTILPLARQRIGLAGSAHASDRAGFADLLTAREALLDVRLARARLGIERERALAAIETWATVDVEAMPSAGLRSMGASPARRPGPAASGDGGESGGMKGMK